MMTSEDLTTRIILPLLIRYTTYHQISSANGPCVALTEAGVVEEDP